MSSARAGGPHHPAEAWSPPLTIRVCLPAHDPATGMPIGGRPSGRELTSAERMFNLVKQVDFTKALTGYEAPGASGAQGDAKSPGVSGGTTDNDPGVAAWSSIRESVR